MPGIAQCAVAVIGGLVGTTAADTCVRATALSLGKSADELTAEDMPALETNIRRLLSAAVPGPAIDGLISEIRTAVS